MSNVIQFPGNKTVEPDDVLTHALGQLTSVIVLGRDSEGDIYFACSINDLPEIFWILEKARHELLDM
jgi:hypothetical protein